MNFIIDDVVKIVFGKIIVRYNSTQKHRFFFGFNHVACPIKHLKTHFSGHRKVIYQ